MLTGATWPLYMNVIRKNKISNTFGMVRHYPNGNPKAHQGWDFSAPIGTPCFAVGSGTVEFVANAGDYGIQMCHSFVADGKTYYAFYAHMQKLAVAKGDAITLDQYIGTTGETGNAMGMAADEQHLHFEIRTQAVCGLGLTGRISPLKVFGVCPLNSPIAG